MLREITIKNVAVIEKAQVKFGPGFNVLTGETGAGKSILIDSINAILGNRTSREIVRSGTQAASIWATFADLDNGTTQKLEEAGYELDEELLLQREISADGKSKCRINGMPATAAILRDICGGLIHIHGQHDNQSLLNPAKHLSILDAYAQNDALRKEYQSAYKSLVAVQKELNALQMNENEKARKLELLQFEIDEIEKEELEPGEEEELLAERNKIQNIQVILDGMNNAYSALSGTDEGEGAVALLSEAASEIGEAAAHVKALKEYEDKLQEMYYLAEEIASEIQHGIVEYDVDTHVLDEIEIRLDRMYRLKQKYGPTIEAVIDYGKRAREELEKIELSDERAAHLEQEKSKLAEKAAQLADQLTESREQAFDNLNIRISKALDFLNMPGISLSLHEKKTALASTGQDEMEFYITTNPGEAPKPLAKIASGGELARIMLALKSALAEKDDLATVIYDEIDTGISGLAAGRIGKLLRSTAAGRQVICITHTAQVAAYASRHLFIQKNVREGRTYTEIHELNKNGRIEELARIISGDQMTELARANAEEMLNRAESKK